MVVCLYLDESERILIPRVVNDLNIIELILNNFVVIEEHCHVRLLDGSQTAPGLDPR